MVAMEIVRNGRILDMFWTSSEDRPVIGLPDGLILSRVDENKIKAIKDDAWSLIV